MSRIRIRRRERSRAICIRARRFRPAGGRYPDGFSSPTGGACCSPAFGAYAGGLDVHDPAVRMLFGRPPRVLMPGRDRVHAFPWSRLAVPDRLRNGGG